jgi:threonine dehydrogenase-like Zn-dependent dehydrogenase
MADEMMKALIWDGRNYPEGMALGEFPRPRPKAGWVTIECKSTGICGSDLHYILGYTRHMVPDRNLPTVMGHETAGVVVELGEGVTGLKVGDRVAAEPLHGCETLGLELCPACRTGQYHLCQNLSIVGVPIGTPLVGGYGKYANFHHTKLYKMPDNVDFEDASLLDLLAVAVHGIKLGKPSMGDTAVILGCGVMGLEQIHCVKAEGVSNIIGVARYDFQAELAKKLGAKEVISVESGQDPIKEVMRLTGGYGADQVYECVGGESDAIDEGVYMIRPGGKVIMLGFFSGRRPVDLNKMLLREADVQASMCYSHWEGKREFQIALDLIANGQADQKPLITHRFPIEEWREAFDTAIYKSKAHAVKVEVTL